MTDSMEKFCEKCGGKLIECYEDEGVKGLLVKNPQGDKLFMNNKSARLIPYVCGKCGFTEWFADEPEKLI